MRIDVPFCARNELEAKSPASTTATVKARVKTCRIVELFRANCRNENLGGIFMQAISFSGTALLSRNRERTLYSFAASFKSAESRIGRP
jgi:hypothetical protein